MIATIVLIRLWIASMRMAFTTVICFLTLTPANAQTPAPLATDPALSPDGKLLAFALAGDIWTVRTEGGIAQRLTTHPAADSKPIFSPDAKRLAFVSQRDGSAEVWIQNISPLGRATGTPSQVTHHTAGYNLEAWYPEGRHLLVSMSRDHYWFTRENTRFAKVAIDERRADQLLFDDFGSAPSLSPDGKSVLFQREGAAWWRKGYVGSQAGQIWRFDSSTGDFTEILKDRYGNHTPLWKPDGKGFYVASQRSGTLNLWEHDFGSADPKQLTHHDDDSVLMPTLSADGSTIVYRHLFDFYRLSLDDEESKPVRINIRVAGDPVVEPMIRRSIDTADRAVFSPDGHELAVVAGGDIWMMDTELREPINVTKSAVEESEPVFVDEGKAMLFLRDQDGAVNIWRAEAEAKNDYWWQQVSFRLTQLTEIQGTVSNLQLNPSGCQIAYVCNRQGLYVADIDGKNSRLVVAGFDARVYDFSPDGRWIAFAQMDNYFNSDIWIVPVDGSAPPVNISRHPKNDFSPKWSPDGRILAFTGVRDAETTDLHYVYLTRQDADATDRDRTLEKARQKIDDARNKNAPSQAMAPNHIDFENIHKRVQRIRISNASIDGLFWFGEKQTLALSATIDGREGTYTIAFPEELKPKFLVPDRGIFATRLENPKMIGLVTKGIPATLDIDGRAIAR